MFLVLEGTYHTHGRERHYPLTLQMPLQSAYCSEEQHSIKVLSWSEPGEWTLQERGGHDMPDQDRVVFANLLSDQETHAQSNTIVHVRFLLPGHRSQALLDVLELFFRCPVSKHLPSWEKLPTMCSRKLTYIYIYIEYIPLYIIMRIIIQNRNNIIAS